MAPLGEDGRCPRCGGDNGDLVSLPHQLPPGSILNNRYLVGRVLGEGGFGITYMGFDLALELKVAIKEYYPAGFVSRDVNATHFVSSVTVPGGGNMFENGKQKCMNEAKTMAKLDELREVVRVRDYFLANNTAYIIMDFVEGVTLKDYVTAHGGRLSMTDALDLLRPVMTALEKVHEAGLIHRDISPDNIMVMSTGEARILDFGAAKSFELGGGATTTMTLKRGFSPVEQYSQTGEQGPWTDVYAMSATLYYCVTGQLPYESIDRISADPLIAPSAAGAALTPRQEKALLRGMAVQPDKRLRSMGELLSALTESSGPPYVPGLAPVPTPTPGPDEGKGGLRGLSTRMGKKLWIALGGAAAVLVVLCLLIFGGKGGGGKVGGSAGVLFGNTSANIMNGTIFYRDGNELWFGDGLDHLYRLDSSVSSYVEDAQRIYGRASCLNVTEDSLYFIDISEGDIMTCARDGSGQRRVYNGEELYFLTYQRSGKTEKLYFLGDSDSADGFSIFSVNPDGSDLTELYDGDCLAVTVTEQYIFFTEDEDYSVRRIDLDGSNEKNIVTKDGIGVVVCGDKVYVPQYGKPSSLLRCDLNGNNRETLSLTLDVTRGFNVDEGYIYYVGENDGYIHRIDTNCTRSSDTVLARYDSSSIEISGDYAYYQYKDESDVWHAEAVDGKGDVLRLDVG